MGRQENTPKTAATAQPSYEPPEAPQKRGFITLLFLLQPTALLIAMKYLTVPFYFPQKKKKILEIPAQELQPLSGRRGM